MFCAPKLWQHAIVLSAAVSCHKTSSHVAQVVSFGLTVVLHAKRSIGKRGIATGVNVLKKYTYKNAPHETLESGVSPLVSIASRVIPISSAMSAIKKSKRSIRSGTVVLSFFVWS